MSNRELRDRQGDEHALLQALMDNIPDAIYFKDMSSRFILINKSQAILAGIERTEEAVGKTDFDFFPEPLAGQYRSDEERIFSTGQPLINKEEKLIDRGGNERWFSTTKIPLRDDSGEITGLMGISRDITQRKKSDDEKELMQEMLLQKHKMEAIGLLTSGIAHNFNNLMTAIQGYTELSLRVMNEKDPHYENTSRVLLTSKRATDLTRQLLLFGRKQSVRSAVIDLNAAIEALLKILGQIIGEDIHVAIDLEPRIGMVQGDPGEIDQVIMNLIVNARDAMPKGGTLSIKTRNKSIDDLYCATIPDARAGDFVCLSITDSGVGIPKDDKIRIFEPFFSTKDKCKGTGLGLSVAYGVVKRHGGWLNVYSEVGKGSTFTAYFPIAKASAPETKSLRITPFPEFEGDGETILLIEDEDVVREFVAKALKDNNYIVMTAPNATEAIDIFKKENGRFDLIFSDVVLPDTDGLHLVKDLLSRKSDLHVLLTSGYADEKSHSEKILEHGFDFLQKPYTLPELFRAVRDAIRGKQKHSNDL
jgi:PAS domain S-box-containing protein